MLTDTKQKLSSFCGHINDCLIGSPLTNKNSGHNRPVFPRISHFRCENSCEIARFTMAVDFSCLQKELLGYVPFGFTQTRNFIIEKAKNIPPLACQPNVSNTQGKLDSFE